MKTIRTPGFCPKLSCPSERRPLIPRTCSLAALSFTIGSLYPDSLEKGDKLTRFTTLSTRLTPWGPPPLIWSPGAGLSVPFPAVWRPQNPHHLLSM